MKKIVSVFLFASFALLANAQMINQNVQYTKVAMFTGKPIVQDTSLYLINGSDTARFTTYANKMRISSTAGQMLISTNSAIIGIGDNRVNMGSDSSIALAADTVSLSEYVIVNGALSLVNLDSVELYSTDYIHGTFAFCGDCTGNGITGYMLLRVGSLWRRLVFE